MRTTRTTGIILYSFAATVLFYAGLALLLGCNEDLLHSLAGRHASLLDGLGVALRRAGRDLAMVAICAIAIYCVYGFVARGLLASRRVSSRRASRSQLLREWMLVTNAVVATGVQAAIYGLLRQLGYTRLYSDIGEYGWAYAAASVVLFLVLADAWFYFSHLVFHRNRFIYAKAHRVHHLSVVTTPWSAYQGSPLELLPSTVFGALVVMTIPLALPVLVVLTVGNALYLMVEHAGVEVFPRGTPNHWLGRWIVTPTYHQMHHELLNRNLGLYFTWWDTLVGTRSAAYAARFARVTGGEGSPAIVEAADEITQRPAPG